MIRGKSFEVSKEVFERAKERAKNKNEKFFYMAPEDERTLFSDSIRLGYGLYGCMVHEEGGKYICTYSTGSSCD